MTGAAPCHTYGQMQHSSTPIVANTRQVAFTTLDKLLPSRFLTMTCMEQVSRSVARPYRNRSIGVDITFARYLRLLQPG